MHQQEAHGPGLAHLSDITTADMQINANFGGKLAKWFLTNHGFIHVNSTVAGKYNKYKQDDGHLRLPIRTILTTADL